MRILLVEDDDDGRFLGMLALESYGYEVDIAANATDAIASIEQQLPDLLLTDISMPGLSGAELAWYVQARSPHTKIIAVTGVYDSSSFTKESGFSAVVAKPVDWPSLQTTIAKVVGQSGTPTD